MRRPKLTRKQKLKVLSQLLAGQTAPLRRLKSFEYQYQPRDLSKLTTEELEAMASGNTGSELDLLTLDQLWAIIHGRQP
jgi:hypothetical protein